jgi:hypothetical protein
MSNGPRPQRMVVHVDHPVAAAALERGIAAAGAEAAQEPSAVVVTVAPDTEALRQVIHVALEIADAFPDAHVVLEVAGSSYDVSSG